MTAQPTTSPSPYVEVDRQTWRRLRDSTPQPLTDAELDGLRGLGDQIDLAEVADVYLPLSRLLSLHVQATQDLYRARHDFLGNPDTKVPFVIAVAGSVAVGKSTTSRILQALLARWPGHPRVDLVTTDGFLLPNARLLERGLLDRKGFPESYDRRGLLRFLAAVKAGKDEVRAPVYSHLVYDIVPGATSAVSSPDILILEGLNVLQTGQGAVFASDFVDFSLYVDAREVDIRRWYVERFLTLRRTAFANPSSYFHRYAALSDAQAVATATEIWDRTNGPNLRRNIAPTRSRATLVLEKGPDHTVRRVRLRKV